MSDSTDEYIRQIDARAQDLVADLFKEAKRSACGRPGTVERAFELAQSGRFHSIVKLRKALSIEGYLDVRAQLDGRRIQMQLNAEMKKAGSPNDA